MVKRTEFICMGCWGTFEPHGNAEGDVICPHCGARQEIQDEPIDLDPEEFVELEALPDPQEAPASMSGSDPAKALADEDFDAVVEIDLDDLDDDEFAGAAVAAPAEEACDVVEHAMADAEAAAEAPDVEPSAGFVPARHWYLRTDRGTIYAFLTAELLVRWARRLSQKPASLSVSTDEEAWQPLPLFVGTLAEAGGLPEDLHVDVDALASEASGLVSDADLERTLRDEAASYDGSRGPDDPSAEATSPDGKATPPQAWPADVGQAAAERAATPTPAAETSAQRVGDFTFKVSEVTESAGGRYVLLLLVGLLLGAGGALGLAWLGVLPPFPF